jgi:hypothetical protein
MRAIILVLILAVVALIIAVQTGFLDIRQTRGAEAPDISANASGVTASGGQAPQFDVETGKVAVGTRPENVTVQMPTVEVQSPQQNQAATTNATN